MEKENNETEEKVIITDLEKAPKITYNHDHSFRWEDDPDYPDRELGTCNCGMGVIRIK